MEGRGLWLGTPLVWQGVQVVGFIFHHTVARGRGLSQGTRSNSYLYQPLARDIWLFFFSKYLTLNLLFLQYTIIMDFIKKAAEGMKGNGSSSTSANTSGQQDDYVDKGTSLHC